MTMQMYNYNKGTGTSSLCESYVPRCRAVIVLSPTVSTAPAPNTSMHVLPLKNWERERIFYKMEDSQ